MQKGLEIFFILDFAQSKRAMATITIQSKVIVTNGRVWVMAITGKDWSIGLVSQNKRICLWHQQLAHVSIARILKIAKLVDNINLEPNNKRYNSAEVLIDLNDSNTSDCSDQKKSLIQNPSIQMSTKIVAEVIPWTATHQIRIKDLNNPNKLCTPYIRNKSTQMVK